ncbi:MAG: hypothetical protein BI182_05895 [Acetobacterium sp. MES1]|uniref:hypothetical protein n=1 Tax=Acetobacterium sp. MES1 TaxID=1899015 RepID=UPI000B9D438C|nr:hypothetical protein [Acetobacterium sp. MES1]OXS25262.1 MAG: hypothetical protein BI182_05895 [Acetobacterium sp. MES1]
MKRQLKRWISLLLVCLMLVSSIPFNVLAQEQQAAAPVANETVDQTEFSGATPDGELPDAAFTAPAVQPEITVPDATVQSDQSVVASESITTAETEDLDVILTADKSSPQNRNTTVTFTATATGGVAPYSYEFTLDGETVVATTNAATIELTAAGTYNIEVTVTDATEGEAETDSTSLSYVIRDNPLVSLTIDPDQTSNHYVNEPVTLQVAVDGGTSPLSYRFYYQLGSASKVEIKNPTINDHLAQVAFTPTKAGSYSLSVEVADSNYLKKTEKINLTVLAPVSAGSFTADKPSGQNVGTTIKLTANGSGGKAPYTYEFSYQLSGDENIVPIDVEKLPTANTVEFTPETPGIYTFIVTIKDNGGLEDKSVTKSISDFHIVNGPVIEAFTATNISDPSNPEKPTYVNDTIRLKVALAEDTGSDGVKYTYIIKNGSKIIKTVTQAGDSYDFTPDSPGTYNFTVKAVDSDNLSDTEATSLTVLKNVAVTLKTDKPSGQKIHTDIKLTAAASGGQAPYSYQFEYVYLDETKVLQYASETKTATFVIHDQDKTGLYTLQVKVTDANGLQSSADINNYCITNPPVIDSFSADPVKGSTVYAGEAITLAASVTEGTGEGALTYIFTDNGVDVTEDPTSASNTCVIPSATAGSHTFEVTVSDGVTTVKQKITSYKVTAGVEVTSLKADKPTGLIDGDIIRLTATGKGGVGPYSYAFYYDFDDGTSPKSIKNPVSFTDPKSKTVSQKLAAGEYTFYVEITDKNGEPSKNGMDKKMVVKVTAPPIITGLKVTDPADATKELTSSYAGDTITLTATTDYTDDLSYTFSYKVGSKTTIITDELDDDGVADDKTAKFKLPAAGSYTFEVKATEDKVDGLTSPAVALQKFTVYKGFAVKSLTTSKPSSQNINTEIKLTATAAGGQAPYTYEFLRKAPSDADFKDITGDPEKNYVIDNTTSEAGNYTYKVVITDAGKTKKDEKTIDFTFTNPFTVTLTADKPSQTVYQGDTVPLTATVDTGADTNTLDYLFYWKMGTETGEIASLTAKTERTQTADFKPEAPGSYTLFVDVIDAVGTVKTAKIASYQVLATLTVDSLVVDKEAPQNIGTTIKLTATGSGGKAPYKYQFYYQLEGSDWEPLGTITTSKSINYRLHKVGTYKLGVRLFDANSTSEEINNATEPDADSVYLDYVVVDKPVITSFTASPSLKYYAGEAITLKAAAKGGSGTYTYAFSYVDSEGATITKEVEGASSSATVTFEDDVTTADINEAITAAGTYQFKLIVTDEDNDDPDSNTAEKTLTYTIVNKPAIKTFKIDNKTGEVTVKKGTSIKLTASGQYGIGTYQYKFWYKEDKDGAVPKMIRSFSGTPTFTYRLPAEGTYIFYVDIKDSKMITDGTVEESKMVKVTVTE